MLDFYFWPTPNGYKPLIFLEEVGLDYRIKPVNIMAGDQFRPEFLKISPNNRMPAIVDGDRTLFESGAILLYLSEKTKQFLPPKDTARYEVVQWLMWQMGGLGPMMGQANYFIKYAELDIPYAKNRYFKETERLLGVLNKQLNDKDYIVGGYSIADMAVYPWALEADDLSVDLSKFPHIADWLTRMGDRPAIKRAYAIGEPIAANVKVDADAKAILFGTAK
ncbi:glutathione S-transferase N-terminal domain-containing protein [Nodosilinea sp. LEGE 07088]|uniref:glutathione S-transferase family protein n=1 Tax=Nodosilinea sp. LEGE 07088 TaxID=2777968 RepID=UPI00187FB2B2|nr:glutathione S-transferase N-terminal domain-containing protein [Nodosilinea sp. LEGE 07088]MBE9140208.1 glutathione S-transferase N-terminal domain-containing protein [Nodosilinea sp. LEGE 07088]